MNPFATLTGKTLTIMVAKGALVPKLKHRRHNAETRPKRRAWNRAYGETQRGSGNCLLQDEATGDGLRLFGGPRPQLAESRARGEISVSFVGANRVHTALDTDLAF